ncbi:hypothetical protein IGI49_003015 [Enterococcus sp. AZ071]|uniref:Uncharacterized protein n=1 Tax=Candidatus Enterococcus ferrettii TaxID=2815324 RepID=A0ABV0EPF5_9ENTE
MIVIAMIGVSYFGYEYHSEIYKTEAAYTTIPNEDPKKESSEDANKKVVEKSYFYNYKLRFVREIEYELSGTDPHDFEPGS